jgi:homogentisate phytyltransferase/homogentisate geranylgeranyltransferase
VTGRAARLQSAGGAVLPARATAFWRFTRPHTVIGTAASIAGLYVLCVDALPGAGFADGIGDLAWTLLAGFCVNVYIVGVNQLEDVEIDRVNKPYLPLAAGDMTRERGRAIVSASAGLAVVLAVSQGAAETIAVLAGLVVGTAYSTPPLRLKRFPVLASLSISGVRSVVVNLGVYAHFSLAFGGGTVSIPAPVWALTLFVLPFSLAIAILKDVPDAEGDRRFRIRTFTVRLGGRRVLKAGLAALTLAYLGMAILGPLLIDQAQPAVLAAGHLAALAVLLAWSRRVDPGDREGFTRFYMRVWKLFFLEYALVALACLAG